MRWAAISIECPAAVEEAVADALMEVGCGGAAAEQVRGEGSAGRPGLLRVTGYLPVDDRLETRLAALTGRLNSLTAYGLPPARSGLIVRWVEDEDWAHAWKSFFRPFRVGRHFVVRPTWEPWDAAADDRILAIDPGMAFGTGTHPTTQLCLELIEERVAAGASVLDVGTGSGILAIAAAALGAAPVVGVDLDPIAVAAARANLPANPSSSDVRLVIAGAAAIRGRYDWVFANLIADVIRDDAALLASRLTRGGRLLASGIIADRAAEVRAALEAERLVIEEERRREEWVALVARQEADEDGTA
jgi:ribosomal protein L11 methyltransferase